MTKEPGSELVIKKPSEMILIKDNDELCFKFHFCFKTNGLERRSSLLSRIWILSSLSFSNFALNYIKQKI